MILFRLIDLDKYTVYENYKLTFKIKKIKLYVTPSSQRYKLGRGQLMHFLRSRVEITN
jgi:hypothetical protein